MGELSADFERLAKPAFTPFADDRRRASDTFHEEFSENEDIFDGYHRRSSIDGQVDSVVPDHHLRMSTLLTGFERLTNGDTGRIGDLTNLLRAVDEQSIEDSGSWLPDDPAAHRH